MSKKKTLLLNPKAIKFLEVPDGQQKPICVSCRENEAKWRAVPPKEVIVRQVEEGKAGLVELCSLCVLYKTPILQGSQKRFREFVEEVENEMEKRFERDGSKLKRPVDADRILGTLFLTTMKFMNEDMVRSALDKAGVTEESADG